MRKVLVCLAVILGCAAALWSQQSAAASQTPRQALIEMFFSKTQGTFAKHLPAITRATLEQSGAMSNMQQYSLLMGQIHAEGQDLQTFGSGPILLTATNTKTGQKFEITVDGEESRGDHDDLRLGFRAYKNGELQHAPFMPQMTFTMKREAEVWTLNEISVTIRVPLADPELLKALTESMKMRAQPAVTMTAHEEAPAQPAGSDAMVLAAMHSIVNAEAAYANRYAAVGYTCTLSDLDGFGGGEPNEHQAMLLNSGLASGRRYGFVFTLSGCSSAPATSFQLTASPNSSAFGRKAFCSDQSGAIKSSDDGNAVTCKSSGTPVR
ncbi:MAG TPA: hypothetical protein VMG31_08675 [Verrucomicrobiae bacterium]|nr:hypothetical protein [Verrucomicrobiae bacterium]